MMLSIVIGRRIKHSMDIFDIPRIHLHSRMWPQIRRKNQFLFFKCKSNLLIDTGILPRAEQNVQQCSNNTTIRHSTMFWGYDWRQMKSRKLFRIHWKWNCMRPVKSIGFSNRWKMKFWNKLECSSATTLNVISFSFHCLGFGTWFNYYT